MYDPSILSILYKVTGHETMIHLQPHVFRTQQAAQAHANVQPAKVPTKTVSIRNMEDGMVLAQNVYMPSGLLLLGKGQEVTPAVRLRLAGLAQYSYIDEYLEVEK
jgi:hypothetical protein